MRNIKSKILLYYTNINKISKIFKNIYYYISKPSKSRFNKEITVFTCL